MHAGWREARGLVGAGAREAIRGGAPGELADDQAPRRLVGRGGCAGGGPAEREILGRSRGCAGGGRRPRFLAKEPPREERGYGSAIPGGDRGGDAQGGAEAVVRRREGQAKGRQAPDVRRPTGGGAVAGGEEAKFTNLDKPLYPGGFTKGRVIDYYTRIGP